MNDIVLLLVSNATSIVCVIGAAIIASKGYEGWGWFLLIALLCSTSPTITNTL